MSAHALYPAFQLNIGFLFLVSIIVCRQSYTDNLVINKSPLPCWLKVFCHRLPLFHDPRSSITMGYGTKANNQNTSYAYRRSSASSSISDANEAVYLCYACKKGIPPKDMHIHDDNGGMNPMFIKPFHLDCVPIYYRYANEIEEEREEERKLEEEQQGTVDLTRRFWGRVSPRKINQPKLV